MASWRVLHRRVEDFKVWKGIKFHALLCDPPYHLQGGFMSKDWDKGGIAFNPDTWRLLASHLLPGAFGMAFASARGWHRLACAIEDAGLRIHPSVFMLGYCYGSGFPKATRIDTQIDKAAGKEQTVVGPSRYAANRKPRAMNPGGGERYNENVRVIREPATDLARAWAGHRYGLQALKPALEPIIIWQKPYSGKAVDSITRTGAGALNIEGGRIGTDEISAHGGGINEDRIYGAGSGIPAIERGANPHTGRWPPNLALQCTCDPTRKDKGEHPNESCPVRRLDEQGGKSNSVRGRPRKSAKPGEGYGMTHTGREHSDEGGPSRFFFRSDWNAEVEEGLLAADPAFYCAKAGRKERDAGLEAVPEKRGEELSGGGGVRHPKADAYQARKSSRRNSHPTVKPIKLCRWLATLLLPPAAYAPRRLLVPFSGAGSEMVGAIQAGWEEVLGIESEREYVEIAEARLRHWEAKQLDKSRGGG